MGVAKAPVYNRLNAHGETVQTFLPLDSKEAIERDRRSEHMRVNPIAYGIFEIIADNDAERVWLSQLLP
jgi:hypothetical protein